MIDARGSSRRRSAGSTLVNTSRGAVVDLDRFARARSMLEYCGAPRSTCCRRSRCRADRRCSADPRVILTPHAAFYSVEAEQRVAAQGGAEHRHVVPHGPAGLPGRARHADSRDDDASTARASRDAASTTGVEEAQMAAVNITAVHKWFGSTQVIRGVDIDIADGEFCVLVGPSGCGKSTLLRMIAGLEEISDGEIAIGGKVVNDVPPKERDIAMVFQNYALYPHMTVRDNMAFALMLAKRRSAEIDAARRTRGRHPRARAVPRPLSAPALRRPAAARGDGPRDRARPAGVPVRRAAVEPRREAARADAHRDQGAAPAPEDDVDLRDARPDRGDDDGRPDRRDARRHRRADRRPARSSTTRRRTRSSPASSARRR